MNSHLHSHGGYLSVYHGSMFAGKTRRLIMKLSKKQDLGLSACYVTHGDDDRVVKGSNLTVGTHWSCFANATVPFDCYRTKDIASMRDTLKKYQVVGIDEFQFFSKQNVKAIRQLVEEDHLIVYVGGLDADFKRNKFGYILDLLLFADKSKKIRAKCATCKEQMEQLVLMNISPNASLVPAISTAKIGGDFNTIKESGGEEKYIPLCRYHYLEYADKHSIILN